MNWSYFRKRYLLILLILGNIGFASWGFYQLHQKKKVVVTQQKPEKRIKDSLRLAQELSQASRFLLQRDWKNAEKHFEKADQWSRAPWDWGKDAQAFGSRQKHIRDSVEYLVLRTKQLIQSNKNRKEETQFLKERVERKLEFTETTWQEYFELLEDYREQADRLQAKKEALEEVKESYGKLHFTTPKGVEVDYFGQTKSQKAHGEGMGVYLGKGFYVGEWKSNKRHGTGKHTWKNGDTYIGEFKNDKRWGEGTYIFAKGQRYEGEWKKDLRHGSGTIYSEDGKKIFEGV